MYWMVKSIEDFPQAELHREQNSRSEPRIGSRAKTTKAAQ